MPVTQFEGNQLGLTDIGITTRYDGTPNRSYAAFFILRSISALRHLPGAS